MNEVMGRPQKLQVERSLMPGDGFGCGIVFEALLKDPLHAINVEEFEPQRSLTGGIEPVGAVAFGQADAASGPNGAGSKETHPIVIDR